MDINKTNKPNTDLVYQLEGRPNVAVALPLGMQHVMAMFTSNLAPILIIAGACGLSGADTVVMVQCAMFVSGLTTFIQLYPIKLGKNRQIGANLPIVMGTSFAFVPTAKTVASMGGIGMVLGGAMVGSLTEVIMGFFYKYIRRFFPPLVVGCTLVTIGVSLLGVGVDYFAGGVGSPDYGSPKNLALGFLSLFIIIILQKFGKGIIKNSAILIGLIIGYIVSAFLGMVNTQAIAEASWFRLPIPMHFKLEFSFSAILSFAVLYITSGLETIGNTSGITIAGFDREATEKETSGAILADALGSTTAAFFNCLPNTAFGQNAGIVSMTKVVNKFCIATGAFVLMLCGFFPKLGAVFSAIPSSVLGGSIITVFAMILINGIKMIAKAGFSERNIIVMGITFALGLGLANHQNAIAQLPEFIKFIFHDTVSATCIISILANLIFPDDKVSKPEDYNA
ncbi:nucleobase:cation symporter-2 family protein [uncultured Brachyspira sp.]|uniref:uracil-xanthine permease family protein n=1 Tax=uncultured Brachyspira sp. TaxID=221953 RepID=UPI00262F8421|nr:nucleobase:cation symporter-2 family protein [uncultured Brachyspira sp.]